MSPVLIALGLAILFLLILLLLLSLGIVSEIGVVRNAVEDITNEFRKTNEELRKDIDAIRSDVWNVAQKFKPHSHPGD